MADYNKLWEDMQGLLGSALLAPARGMMAQSPEADFGGGLLGNFLTKAHKAIDPVNALGGYGNVAAMALPPGAPKGKMPSMTGHAKAGGEVAKTNGYFYKGGQFLPSTDLPPGSFRVGKKIVKAKKMETAPSQWETQPSPTSRSVYQMAAPGYYSTLNRESGKLSFNQGVGGKGVRDPRGNTVTAESKAIGDLTFGDLIEMYNKGMRWVDVP